MLIITYANYFFGIIFDITNQTFCLYEKCFSTDATPSRGPTKPFRPASVRFSQRCFMLPGHPQVTVAPPISNTSHRTRPSSMDPARAPPRPTGRPPWIAHGLGPSGRISPSFDFPKTNQIPKLDPLEVEQFSSSRKIPSKSKLFHSRRQVSSRSSVTKLFEKRPAYEVQMR